MHLRSYQADAIASVRALWDAGTRSCVIVAATGAGKTNMFLALLCGPDGVLTPGRRGLILAHRSELIDQPVARLHDLDPAWDRRVAVVQADRDGVSAQLAVATVQTLAQPARLQRLLAAGPIDYVVTDECHHATSASYRAIYAAIERANAAWRHLGVTATPIRSDGAGLGQVFDAVAARITIKDLVPTYLVPPRWLGIQTSVSLKGVDRSAGEFVQSQLASVYETDNCLDLVAASHLKYAYGRTTLAFTSSVQGAYRLAARFQARGIRAAAADGTTPSEVRANVLALLRSGAYDAVCNANLWTEGLDLPEVSCIHVATPCASDARYTQIVGRGLRPYPGKTDCLILDYLPVDPRNICMLGDVLGVPTRVAVRKVEEGEVAGGLTFDGRHVRGLKGDALELLARDLGYLEGSPFRWDRMGGLLLLGLGPSRDGDDRTLVIPEGDAEVDARVLYLVSRRGAARVSELARGPIELLIAKAHAYAEEYGNGTLIEKKRRWRKEPASSGQVSWLLRLAPQREIAQYVDGAESLSKGQAASLITFFLARAAMERSGKLPLASAPNMC